LLNVYSFDNVQLPKHVDNHFSGIASVHKFHRRLACFLATISFTL